MDKKIPYSGGPRRLAFHIRKSRAYGSTSLLITNRFGVWSAVRCRHVKKTWHLRFHKLKDDACSMEDGYILLRNLGVNDDQQVTFWRCRLADFYWNAMPPGHRAHAIEYFRWVTWNKRLVYFVFNPFMVVLLAAICVLEAQVLMSDKLFLVGFCLALCSDVLLYKAGAKMCRAVSDYNDNIVVELLDELACKCDNDNYYPTYSGRLQALVREVFEADCIVIRQSAEWILSIIDKVFHLLIKC